MAITFLTAVVDVLARVSELPQDVSAISSFNDSARSLKISLCRQAWNDVLLDVATCSTVALPKTVDKSTLTLQEGVIEYNLPSTFEQMIWPLTCAADGSLITEYQGGFEAYIIERCQPQLFVGSPRQAVIRPTDRKLLVDATPTSAEDGTVYDMYFDKSITLSTETDLFPFSDDAVRALYGAVAELYKYERQRVFDNRKYNAHKATALRIITPSAMDTQW